jgi:hemerythrin-like domain-containing protein
MDVTGNDSAPGMARRDLLRVPAALAGGLAVTACGPVDKVRANAPVQTRPPREDFRKEGEAPVTPPEDLMREHGVLKRVLLIYREGIRRIDGGQPVPGQALQAGAHIIRSFIEDYHERLEERYVFPRLVKSGKLTDIVPVLLLQHQRGRALTTRILDATRASASPGTHARRDLATAMSAFVGMYEPHEAREDTVVFPALRDVVPAKEFSELGEVFEEEEHRLFGASGFTGVVGQVADIEKTLGIYDLAKFTPQV